MHTIHYAKGTSVSFALQYIITFNWQCRGDFASILYELYLCCFSIISSLEQVYVICQHLISYVSIIC